jgi:hypothetical protein
MTNIFHCKSVVRQNAVKIQHDGRLQTHHCQIKGCCARRKTKNLPLKSKSRLKFFPLCTENIRFLFTPLSLSPESMSLIFQLKFELSVCCSRAYTSSRSKLSDMLCAETLARRVNNLLSARSCIHAFRHPQ